MAVDDSQGRIFMTRKSKVFGYFTRRVRIINTIITVPDLTFPTMLYSNLTKAARRKYGDLASFSGALALLSAITVGAAILPTPRTGPVPTAPPPAPPPEVRNLPEEPLPLRQAVAGPALYSIGDPTDEEQLYLEYINRARANPAAEGQRLRQTDDPQVRQAYKSFFVDLDLMVSQFGALAPAPPLSMNAKLLASARLHSQDMLAIARQQHAGSDGSTNGSRATAQGYVWTTIAENIYANSESVWQGHAGFQVDWGTTNSTGTNAIGGMQNPPGHRLNIHSAAYREAGIGVVNGQNTVGTNTVGPQLVTQDFATAQNATPFVTGVAYYDLIGNGFYDPGEGLGGVTVTIPGASFLAVTSNSGGYSVPVPGNGVYTVTFSAPGLSTLERTITITNSNNAKADFTPAYSPPTISGPDVAITGQNNSYSFTAVGAATGYEWRQTERIVSTVEGAENGLARITAVTSPGYTVIVNDVKASGTKSFHLTHTNAEPQYLTLNRIFLLGQTSKLEFQSRLGWAAPDQVARAQVSLDDGKSWQDIWTQAGTDNSGEGAFHGRSVSLAAHAGKEVRVRFVYDFTFGQFFNQTDSGVGLYLDDIIITDAEELVNQAITAVQTGTSFNFAPASQGSFALQVRAKVSNRLLNWGPIRLISAQEGTPTPPAVTITAIQVLPGNQVQLDFELTAGTAAGFTLETAPALPGTWSADNAASIQTVSPNKFRVVRPNGDAAQHFYRLRVN